MKSTSKLSAIQRSNKTARSKGAVGQNAKVPRLVSERFYLQDHILDYGCGPDMIHVKKLISEGFDVDGFDFGDNVREDMITTIYRESYDVIYASNVLNTWSDPEMVLSSLTEIRHGLKPDGIFLCNLPESPRYYLDNNTVKTYLADFFNEIKEIEKNVYHCMGKNKI